MSAPKIQSIQLNEYNCKQSKYNDAVPTLPMKSMLVGPNGGGKTVFLTNMILDIYIISISIYNGSIFHFSFLHYTES